MKRWFIRITLALLTAIVVVGLWKREDITRLMAVNTLFDDEKIVSNFSNMDDLFLSTKLTRGSNGVSPLLKGDPLVLPNGFDDWAAERDLTAIVVLHNGLLVHEAYYKDTQPEDQRIAWSVSKSWLSALFGIMIEEGVVSSIDDRVVDYVPELAGTAYDTATIKNVLQMSSGVVFNEDYFDYDSDINKMGRVLALGGSMDDFAADLDATFAPAGQEWQYTSIDTHILGMVLRNASGRSLSDLMTEKVIAPLGLEADAYYVTDGYDVAFALGGINIRTRDNARFGQMYVYDGMWQGKQIVPVDWIAESTVASAPKLTGEMGYGYQWWMPAGAKPGVFHAQGVYGQYIYIDKNRNVVIATNAADKQFRADGVSDQNMAMFAAIAASFD